MSGVSGCHFCHCGRSFKSVRGLRIHKAKMGHGEGKSFDREVKPSNPKDALGIRKVPMSVVPADVLLEVALALLEGACKYGRYNYRAVGVRASVYYDATMRHLMDWWEGTDIDPDSQLHHVTKAIASLTVLRDAMLHGLVTDDRPPRGNINMKVANDRAGEMIDRYADSTPHHYTIEDNI